MLNYPMLRIAIPQLMQISNIELSPLKKDLQSCLPYWDHVLCPVTFIHGDVDNLVSIGNVAFGEKMLVNSSGLRKVILPGHGHFIMWSHVNVISGEIVRMITDTDVSYDHEVKTQ